MGLKDGLPDREVHSTTFSGTNVLGTNISGTTLAVGAGEVGNAELADAACSGTKVSAEFGTIANGSPSAYGQSVQAGTGTLGAGSDVWVTFGTGFAAAPEVVVTPTASLQDIFVEAGSTNTGSFYAQGETASETFSYVAVGSGRL